MTDAVAVQAQVDRQARKLSRFVYAAVALAFLVLLIGTAATLVTGYQIYDCIHAGGSCYEKGQKRTGAVVQQLITDQRCTVLWANGYRDVPTCADTYRTLDAAVATPAAVDPGS